MGFFINFFFCMFLRTKDIVQAGVLNFQRMSPSGCSQLVLNFLLNMRLVFLQNCSYKKRVYYVSLKMTNQKIKGNMANVLHNLMFRIQYLNSTIKSSDQRHVPSNRNQLIDLRYKLINQILYKGSIGDVVLVRFYQELRKIKTKF